MRGITPNDYRANISGLVSHRTSWPDDPHVLAETTRTTRYGYHHRSQQYTRQHKTHFRKSNPRAHAILRINLMNNCLCRIRFAPYAPCTFAPESGVSHWWTYSILQYCTSRISAYCIFCIYWCAAELREYIFSKKRSQISHTWSLCWFAYVKVSLQRCVKVNVLLYIH